MGTVLMNKKRKGFTLIELLIVIGILTILATVVTLILNPAELLRQARDTQRISDLSSMRSALAFYIATVSSPDLDGAQTCSSMCFYYTGASGGSAAAGCGSTPRHGTKTATGDDDRTVDALGWIPVNFGSISGGAPLAVLPIDPVDSTTYYYTYACDNTNITFELNAVLESVRYKTTEDFDGKDGGSSTSYYEVGTEPGLDL